MIQSCGAYVKQLSGDSTTIWTGRLDQWPDSLQINSGWQSYAELYSKQLWVSVLVNKRAKAAARLPLKTYEKTPTGRRDASSSPYGQLLRRPSNSIHPVLFWQWVCSTFDIHGEAFLGKIRDRGGRPIELVPLAPQYIKHELIGNRWVWSYVSPTLTMYDIARRDLVHFRTFNARSNLRGASLLEPLRSTLENEDGARRANAAMWKNGGRPSVVLEHPSKLSDPAYERISASWANTHGGVDNWAKAVILEESMKANVVPLNVEDLQYIEGRRLNREECCAAFDMPPAAVQILDRATFSNITENLRSVYRDTMAPILGVFESTLDFELRDGRFDDLGADPDFGESFYCEFLMEEVLRGDFEARQQAYAMADYMTIAEKRERENLPPIAGTDVLFINSAYEPLQPDGTLAAPEAAPAPAKALAPAPALPTQQMRSLMGVIGRTSDIGAVDWGDTAKRYGLEPALAASVVEAAAAAVDVSAFKSALRQLNEGASHDGNN